MSKIITTDYYPLTPTFENMIYLHWRLP